MCGIPGKSPIAESSAAVTLSGRLRVSIWPEIALAELARRRRGW